MTEHLPVSEISRPVAVLDRAGLARAVALAAMAADRKSAIPILSNLRLRGYGGALEVIGTDCDLEISVMVEGPADARLDLTVPAHMLKDILTKAKDSALASLDDASNDDVFRCGVDLGGVKFKLNAIPATDFPVLDPVSYGHSFQVDADTVNDLLGKTSFAISTEETRYYLNGIHLHSLDRLGVFRAVSTDGHRLAMMEIPAPEGSLGMPGVILPRRAVGLLIDAIKLLGKGKETLPMVRVEIASDRARFTIGGFTLTSKLVDGSFPDYERVVPRSGDMANIDVKEAKDAISQISLISGNPKGQTVKFSFARDRLVLSCRDDDNGTSEAVVPCGSAATLEIGFAARYLIDILAEISAGHVFMWLTDSGSPAVFTDPCDPRFKAVLMPKRF